MYYFYRTFELFCFECMLKKRYEVFLRYEKKKLMQQQRANNENVCWWNEKRIFYIECVTQ